MCRRYSLEYNIVQLHISTGHTADICNFTLDTCNKKPCTHTYMGLDFTGQNIQIS